MEKLVSNDDVKAKAYNLVKAIKASDDYKEYKVLRKKLQSNKTIMDKMAEIKALQKKYVKSGYLDEKIEFKLNKLTNELESNTLYKNYLEKETLINSILLDITEGLNLTMERILNKEND